MTKTIIAPDINPYFNVGAQIGAIEKQIALSQVNDNMIIVKIFTALVLCLYFIGNLTARYLSILDDVKV